MMTNVAGQTPFSYIHLEMDSYWLEVAVIVILILANGFFAASEYALISARKSRIAQLAQKGSRKAKLVRRLQSQPDSFVAAIQVGITLVGTLASVVGGATLVSKLNEYLSASSIPFLSKFAGSLAIGAVVVTIAFLTLVIGELVPKRLGLQHSTKISLAVVNTIRVFMWLAFVPIRILTFASRLVLRILGLHGRSPGGQITEDEIVQIISEGKSKGEFSQEEQDLVSNVFEFTETTVHKIMTPRTDISAVNSDWNTDKALEFITIEGFSRYPVFKDSIDNVVGMIYTRDIINVFQHKALIILHDIMRTPFFVPDSKNISELLKDFQRLQLHMAIVLDEFGGTAGVVTMEDILEEIVGEIWDEYDAEEQDYRKNPDGSIVISSRMDIDDFNEVMDTNLPEDLADTMGGFIYTYLGEIPAAQQVIHYEDLRFTVVEKTGHRIEKIKVTRVKHPDS